MVNRISQIVLAAISSLALLVGGLIPGAQAVPTYTHTAIYDCDADSPTYTQVNLDSAGFAFTNNYFYSNGVRHVVDMEVGETVMVSVSGSDCLKFGLIEPSMQDAATNVSSVPAYTYSQENLYSPIANGSVWILTLDSFEGAYGGYPFNLAEFTIADNGYSSISASLVIRPVISYDQTITISCDNTSANYKKISLNGGPYGITRAATGTSADLPGSYPAIGLEVGQVAKILFDGADCRYDMLDEGMTPGTVELDVAFGANDTLVPSGAVHYVTAKFVGNSSEEFDELNTFGYYDNPASAWFGFNILVVQPQTASYTVTFDANGGTGSMSSQSASTSSTLNANTFTKSRYVFDEWNTAADGSGTSYANEASYDFESDITLYAQWLPDNHTVTFNSNGGTGSMSSQTTHLSSTLTANSFERSGYTFDGWNTAADGSGTDYADSATFNFLSNITLYAQWTEVPASYFSVTFNANGGTGSMSSQSANAPTALNAVAFSRCGYEFAGWTTQADGSGSVYSDGATYPFLANVTLYAAWSADEANGGIVTFNANGGTGSMTSQCSTSTSNLSSNGFSRSGFTFIGWNTAADGSGVGYANNASYAFGVSISLYAQWTLITYTVSFDSNGGTGSMDNQVAVGANPLESNGFKRSGYRFIGWNTAADGSGVDHANGASFNFASNLTLYAQWEFIVVDELPEIEPIPENAIDEIGDSICTIDGQSIEVTLTSVFNANEINIDGDGFSMALAGLDAKGDKLELDQDGNLVLQNDRLAYVEGTGFLPDSDIKLYLFSTPTYLGTVRTDANGNFSGTVEIPQEIEAGIHTLQANGYSDDGNLRSMSLGVSVTNTEDGGKKKIGKAKLFFANDSALLTKSAKKAIKKMLKQLGSKKLKIIRLWGFATPSDSFAADRKLSKQRAIAVQKYLKSIGVKGEFKAVGKGRSKTQAPTGRRVAIKAWWIKPAS